MKIHFLILQAMRKAQVYDIQKIGISINVVKKDKNSEYS